MSDGVKEYVAAQKEVEQIDATRHKTNKRNIIISAIIGIILVLAGTLNLFDSEEANLAALQAGAEQSMTGIIQMYPDSQQYIQKVVDALDAAVQARTTSPDALAEVVNTALDATVPDLEADAIVRAVVTQINNAHKVSETEELYIKKLQALLAGIRAAARYAD